MATTNPLPPSASASEQAAFAQMERLVQDLSRLYQERNEAMLEIGRAHHEGLLRLALAAELRDDDTGIHIVRMGLMCEALALAVGESETYAGLLRRAAPMHDVGKIGIPDQVLKKPGALTAEERQVMNRHPELGAQILGQSRVPLFQLAGTVALGHHERWNGSGYPRGLSGTDIPLCARICAVVDFFDALTMDRCYRKALPDDVALDMLQAESGRAFEPRLVQAFVAHADAMIALREEINRRSVTFEDLARVDARDLVPQAQELLS